MLTCNIRIYLYLIFRLGLFIR